MCLCLAFTQNHLIKFQEIQSPAVHSGFRTYRWLNVEIWQGLSGSLLIIPGCSCGGQVNASRKSRMGVSGCLCTKNSGQTIHSHTFNTQILFDPFIIVVVDITSLCLGNLSSLACMALHPLCNATPLLYLENSQGLMEVGLSYHPWPGRWWCVKWCPLLQETMLWHRAALGGREPGVGKLLLFKWRN